ncbi:hypothetical protein ONZ43_g2989 [Nemania bipapillata]|uniref:Uncharacterized protein n=1 Tax=Nemania bipapillata TaxID=110536 RepID=A0ACC2IYH7_9PEZI|nr:hypothetical protein ONZ43_g2989 [Nemania bipapillata]
MVPPLSSRHASLGTQIHPSPLTPGFPGTQMAIQSGGGGGGGNGDREWDLGNAPLRATLNATEDERVNNLYATSWANGP